MFNAATKKLLGLAFVLSAVSPTVSANDYRELRQYHSAYNGCVLSSAQEHNAPGVSVDQAIDLAMVACEDEYWDLVEYLARAGLFTTDYVERVLVQPFQEEIRDRAIAILLNRQPYGF